MATPLPLSGAVYGNSAPPMLQCKAIPPPDCKMLHYHTRLAENTNNRFPAFFASEENFKSRQRKGKKIREIKNEEDDNI
jgi:hypothetical protein